MLWSTTFRAPFVKQVERLLRQRYYYCYHYHFHHIIIIIIFISCIKILEKTKSVLISSLAQEGLIVDKTKLTVTTNINNNNKSNECISPRIFRLAETIRLLLEYEVTLLVEEIVAPIQEGDPLSASSLSRALLVQCSYLCGQLSVILRTLAISINNTLEVRIKSRINANANATGNDDDNALLSGLLIVGRLAWLLKSKGGFFEDALVPLSVTKDTTSFEYISEEQLKSAFEIADTDGDGVVTSGIIIIIIIN